jgi:hypothetical protein
MKMAPPYSPAGAYSDSIDVTNNCHVIHIKIPKDMAGENFKEELCNLRDLYVCGIISHLE